MIEAQLRNELDVGGGGKGLEAMDGVVIGLGKPDAGVDAVLEMPGAGEGEGVLGGIVLSDDGKSRKKGSEKQDNGAAMRGPHTGSLIPCGAKLRA